MIIFTYKFIRAMKYVVPVLLLLLIAKQQFAQENPSDVTIWSDDFSNSYWWSAHQSEDLFPCGLWTISANGPTGEFSHFMGKIISESSNNGFAIFDSEAVGTPNYPQDSWIEYNYSFDCFGSERVILYFQSYYQHKNGSCFLEVSNNSGYTWTSYPVHEDMFYSECSYNPSYVGVDISTVAANKHTVKIRFRYQGMPGFAWMVDDVEVHGQPNHDLKLVDGRINYFNFPHYYNIYYPWSEYYHYSGFYGQIPIDQMESPLAGLVFDAIIRNNGTEPVKPQVHVIIESPEGFYEYDNVFVADDSIMPNTQDTLFVCDEVFYFSKPVPGKYVFSYQVTENSIDDDFPQDNWYYDTIELTTNRLSRCKNNISAVFEENDLPLLGYNYSPVYIFEFTRSTYIEGFELYYPQNDIISTSVIAKFYKIEDPFWPYLMDQDKIGSTSCFYPEGTDWMNDWFFVSMIQQPNDEFIYIEVENQPVRIAVEVSAETKLAIDYTVHSEGREFGSRYGSGILFFTRELRFAPLFRLITGDGQVGNNTSAALCENIRFNNPASELLNISFSNGLINSNLKIFDITGKCFLSQMIGNQREILNIGYLKPGIYFLQVENTAINKKLVVE